MGADPVHGTSRDSCAPLPAPLACRVPCPQRARRAFSRLQDNSEIIDICDGKEKGIYTLLDSVCKAPKATDETLAAQLFESHTRSKILMRPKSVGQKGKSKDPKAKAVTDKVPPLLAVPFPPPNRRRPRPCALSIDVPLLRSPSGPLHLAPLCRLRDLLRARLAREEQRQAK